MANSKIKNTETTLVFDNGTPIEVTEAHDGITVPEPGNGFVKVINSIKGWIRDHKIITSAVCVLVAAAVAGAVLGNVNWGITAADNAELTTKNETLTDENENLKGDNKDLTDKNEDLNKDIENAKNEARETALNSYVSAREEADSAITAAQDAYARAGEVYGLAIGADNITQAVTAYKMAIENPDSSVSAIVNGVEVEVTKVATTQASEALTQSTEAKTKVQNALDLINKIADADMTSALKEAKTSLEAYLVDNSSVPMTLELDDEGVENSVTVVDAVSISGLARTTAENAASIALNKILEYASEINIPNEVVMDLASDSTLANLIKGSNTGKVEKLIRQQNVGDTLILDFAGVDGQGRNAIFELSVDTKDCAYKYGSENSDAYTDEIKGLIREQKIESVLYSQVGEESVFFNVENRYNKKADTSKITYSVRILDEEGSISASETTTLQRQGRFTEEKALQEAQKHYSTQNATYVFVVDGEETQL